MNYGGQKSCITAVREEHLPNLCIFCGNLIDAFVSLYGNLLELLGLFD